MSRIGRKIIVIPKDVKVSLKDGIIHAEGAKGKLSLPLHGKVEIAIENGQVSFKRKDEEILSRAAHGTMRSVLANMIKGVSEGFMKTLEINGVGYKAELKGQDLSVSVGYSYPKLYRIPAGIKVEVEKGTWVKIIGVDKQLVGKVASEIRKIRPPEPYKGKGIKYSTEVIKRKVGKAAVTQAT